MREREREKVYLCDFQFIEYILKHLIVLNHFILILSIEINLMHRHDSRMSGIKKLAVNSTWTCLKNRTITKQIYQNLYQNRWRSKKLDRRKLNLFDFGEIELKSWIDPSEYLRSTNEVCSVHNSNVCRHFFFFFS